MAKKKASVNPVDSKATEVAEVAVDPKVSEVLSEAAETKVAATAAETVEEPVSRIVPTAGSYPFVPKPTPSDGFTTHVRAVAEMGLGDVNPYK